MNKESIHRLVGTALLGATVVVLQLLGSFIRFGPVSVCLVMLPIVFGTAVYGPRTGAFLGGVFGIVVLCQPDTAAFYQISVIGTIVTVLAKGILSGWLGGLVYRTLARKNEWVAVVSTAVVCPVVNTAVFFLGCRVFFWSALAEWGAGDAFVYIITALIGVNFLAELGINIICSPAIPLMLRAVRHN